MLLNGKSDAATLDTCMQDATDTVLSCFFFLRQSIVHSMSFGWSICINLVLTYIMLHGVTHPCECMHVGAIDLYCRAVGKTHGAGK